MRGCPFSNTEVQGIAAEHGVGVSQVFRYTCRYACRYDCRYAYRYHRSLAGLPALGAAEGRDDGSRTRQECERE